MFRSRAERKVEEAGYDPARLPPGQYLTEKWPVLHAGGVPDYPPDLAGWDFHNGITANTRSQLPPFDQAFAALIRDLDTRGMLDRTLVMVSSEFGRTPKIAYQDQSGRPGRDHWPRAMSVLLDGGGLKMGQVIGATNSRAEEPVERIMDSNCLLATIYRRFGIDTSSHFVDNTGRPIPILTTGEPIAELL